MFLVLFSAADVGTQLVSSYCLIAAPAGPLLGAKAAAENNSIGRLFLRQAKDWVLSGYLAPGETVPRPGSAPATGLIHSIFMNH